MTCAQMDAERIERLVLIDLVGTIDPSSAIPVVTSVGRLGMVLPSADVAIGLMKQTGVVPEWNDYWERYFRYELKEVEGGVTASSDRAAVLEDLGYGNAMYFSEPEPPIRALWRSVAMPALLVRATQEIMPGFEYILPKDEAERFIRAVPHATLVEVDATHYTISMNEVAASAIREFLSA
jgi:pimeloyl-ACP methyl ester carboxylesterase